MWSTKQTKQLDFMSTREFTIYCVTIHAQQTTADLHSAVGGTCISHLVTIDATRTKIGE